MKLLLKSTLIAMLLLLAQGCSKTENENPLDTAQTNLVRTWRAANVSINNLPLALLGAAVPGIDITTIRLTFRADKTFQASGLGILGTALPPTGTWAFDNNNPNKIIINPGNLSGELSNLSAIAGTMTFQISTANTPLSALGPMATIRVDMVPG